MNYFVSLQQNNFRNNEKDIIDEHGNDSHKLTASTGFAVSESR
jgi:hypothetical protein